VLRCEAGVGFITCSLSKYHNERVAVLFWCKFGLAIAIALPIGSMGAAAADRFFMYNLTTSTTFTGVFLAPAGTVQWGTNQTLNDKDHEIEPSERLPIKGIGRGLFDVRLIDRKGRVCVTHGVDLRMETTFETRDKNLTDCHVDQPQRKG
jgi:hypothetical protein